MIDTLAGIQTYFQYIAESHPLINDFVVGDSDEILSMDRSRLNYPVLWLETPTVSYTLGDYPVANFDTYFSVLINTPVDTPAHQQYMLNRTLLISQQILSQIKQDHQEGHILFNQSRASSDPILGYGHDNDYGWRNKLSLGGRVCAACDLYDSSIVEHASFSVKNNSLGDFSNMTFTDTSNISDVEEVEWTWQIDNNAAQSGTSIPSNLGAGSRLYITLKVTDTNGVIKYATAFVSVVATCEYSIPSLLPKSYCS